MRKRTIQNFRKQQRGYITELIQKTLNVVFHPYIVIYRMSIESSMDDQIYQDKIGMGGERGPGDGCGEGCALIFMELVYFFILNIFSHYILKWAFSISGFWIDTLVFVVLLALSFFYLILSEPEIKKMDKEQKERWRDRNRKNK